MRLKGLKLALQEVAAANNDEEALAVDLIPRRLSPPTPVRPTTFRWLMKVRRGFLANLTDMLVNGQTSAASFISSAWAHPQLQKEAQLGRVYSTRSRARHIAEVVGGPYCDETWLGT
ncbi:hypothetical protein MCOR02_010307 [Pyricularia oryzae]|uniref:Uncharacterized protein n=4 Tax=Pyricularia oryzae TaxID=318829 RepID=G4MNI9_PYRO7|nr:uncharacterized protein MGG_13138 [Pyricularia oryzae 70-15]ELQ36970.1 hypothetical protein OOU_Y34scaffold00624g66 [Pyricularia oryzae Y34]KAH9428885.1 hypothetical protein MCOR02_010307 [Pyricularia oryzae]EHA57895.1 hypothetical protein MGG_13138 [Pyricularia oryzae 70-15]KAI6305461.1 hypothetical protein MCOR34_008543 [Pyricularia oryzae]KAI6316610.1 hypothetical protein MCOR29_006640 [Pyricularia oryzae]